MSQSRTYPKSHLFDLILQGDEKLSTIHLELCDFLALYSDKTKYDNVENLLNEFKLLNHAANRVIKLMFEIKNCIKKPH